MYIAIRRYELDPNDVEEVTRKVDEGFVPLLKGAKGFRGYHFLDTGDGVMASISIFDDAQGAEESVKLAADFVREELAPLLPGSPQVTAGRVVVTS